MATYNYTGDQSFAIVGTFIHSTVSNPLIILQDVCMGVKNGKITFLKEVSNNLDMLLDTHGIPTHAVRYLTDSQFVIPGFIDTHIHASQYPNCGKGLDEGLLKWLHKYTFPEEAKFKDLQYAKDTYRKVVSRVLRNGTTTACYFATIDTDATITLCDVIGKMGQRALVGKVNMDQHSPDYYRENTQQSLKDTQRFVDAIENMKNPRIKACITPRFAISCGMNLMKGLAEIAEKHNLHIQTHVCETVDENNFVKDIYPNNENYIDVYDEAGLITDKTILAHGIYLTSKERSKMQQRGCGLSHCPNSNLTIRSGLLDLRQCLQENLTVGLGTDVSAGYSTSIMDAMRLAITTSNALSINQGKSYEPVNYKEVFRMATLGGSQVLHMEDTVGNFETGKQFDALVIDLAAQDSVIDVFPNESKEEYIQKFIYLGDDRNIVSVYVAGNEVVNNLG